MKNPGNVIAFIKLIVKYKSITTKEIVNGRGYGLQAVLNNLTGFGSKRTCTLCKEVKEQCSMCIYSYFAEPKEGTPYCNDGTMKPSYQQILKSRTALSIVRAVHRRAKRMHIILLDYLANNVDDVDAYEFAKANKLLE